MQGSFIKQSLLNRTHLTKSVSISKFIQHLEANFFFFVFLSYLAIEEAIRLRERLNQSTVNSIRAITIGPPKSIDVLRTALALGADSAIHVETPESSPSPEPLAVAKIIQAVIEKQNNNSSAAKKDKIDLVILGKQSIDDDLGTTGQMLAGLLGWSQATFASKVDVDVEKEEAVVVREIDGGSEEVRCRLPLVVTTDLR